MTSAISPIQQTFSIPYLTLNEFKNAPTAIDINNLVFNSIDPDAQDAELTNVIARASSWVDTYCNQILGATTETEQQRSRVKGDGTIRFHPNNSPIIAITDLWYGYDSYNLVQVTDPSICWLESQQVIFPYASFGSSMTSQGPLGFGFPSTPQQEVYLKYSYINGYPNTTIITATAGQSTLTVAHSSGIRIGDTLKIYDSLNTENVIVASTYTFGSTTVPLTSALVYTHSAGVSISGLPPAIKEATILVTTQMLKVRGDNSMIMNITTSAQVAPPGSTNIGTDMAMAMDLLKPYRRIR
jgi:hypothetical protein